MRVGPEAYSKHVAINKVRTENPIREGFGYFFGKVGSSTRGQGLGIGDNSPQEKIAIYKLCIVAIIFLFHNFWEDGWVCGIIF